MLSTIWELLLNQKFGAVLSLWGGLTGTHSMISGLRSSRDMDRLIQEIRSMQVQVNQLADRVYIAPASRVVVTPRSPPHSAAPAARREMSSTKNVIDESIRLRDLIGQPLLTSAIAWTPEKFNRAFNRGPGDVLVNVQPASQAIPLPSDGQLLPVLFSDACGTFVGWQKRSILEQLFNICIDDVQLTSLKGVVGNNREDWEAFLRPQPGWEIGPLRNRSQIPDEVGDRDQ